MRVLIANSTCKVGGVSTFMLSLHRALMAAGHDSQLFFFERGPMEAHLPDDVPVRFGTLADCLRLIAADHIDVVQANNVDWTTGIAAVRRAGARLVLTAHKVREGAWTYGWTRRDCDHFVAVSRWIADALQPHTDIPIAVLHNGIDTTRFTPGDLAAAPAGGAPIVAWVGRGSAPRKQLNRFAATAPALREAGYRIWVIDQQGPARVAEVWPDAAATLTRCADRWEGVPYEAMPQVFRDIAATGGCVVSTASMEGLPLTLLEAQACGAVVIAERAPGVDECVSPGSGGVLVGAGEDLATVVQRTLADRAGMHHRQQLAVQRAVEQFSVRRMCEGYLSLYASVPARRLSALHTARVRLGLSPLRWRTYQAQRLGVGYRQFEAAEALLQSGDTRLARAAAMSAVCTAPTMFVKPLRLARLAHIMRSAGRRDGRSSMTTRWTQGLAVSPREKEPKACGSDDVLDGRKPCQMGWYAFVAEQCAGQSVLDVGCGSGEGLKALASHARRAVGIDLDERLRRPDLNIEIKSIEDVPDKSFDIVTCLDVIEHVPNDRHFVAELMRVARTAVFVTTPNYTISRNRHPYHVREYTPGEFERLFASYGNVTLYAGSARGHERVEVRRRLAYRLVNALYIWKPTQLLAKVVKRLLRVRVWKHNAALIRLSQPATASATAEPVRQAT